MTKISDNWPLLATCLVLGAILLAAILTWFGLSFWAVVTVLLLLACPLAVIVGAALSSRGFRRR